MSVCELTRGDKTVAGLTVAVLFSRGPGLIALDFGVSYIRNPLGEQRTARPRFRTTRGCAAAVRLGFGARGFDAFYPAGRPRRNTRENVRDLRALCLRFLPSGYHRLGRGFLRLSCASPGALISWRVWVTNSPEGKFRPKRRDLVFGTKEAVLQLVSQGPDKAVPHEYLRAQATLASAGLAALSFSCRSLFCSEGFLSHFMGSIFFDVKPIAFLWASYLLIGLFWR